MQLKHIQVQIQKATDDDHDAVFVMSSGSPDRVHDTIDPKAYRPNLGKTLIALWQHKADSVVGYWKDLEVRGQELVGKFKAANTGLGRMVKQLIEDGVPLGASIGFYGKGKANEKGGVHYSEVELMETSIVSVPCHPGAIQIAKSFGIDPSSVVEPEEPESGHQAATGNPVQQAKQAVLAANRLLRNKP